MAEHLPENMPERVLVMAAMGTEGFEPLTITDADGEHAFPVFTDGAKLEEAIRTLVHGTLMMKQLDRRGLVPGGVEATFEEASRMAIAAGCDYIGLDMGQGTLYRTFYPRRATGGADS